MAGIMLFSSALRRPTHLCSRRRPLILLPPALNSSRKPTASVHPAGYGNDHAAAFTQSVFVDEDLVLGQAFGHKVLGPARQPRCLPWLLQPQQQLRLQRPMAVIGRTLGTSAASEEVNLPDKRGAPPTSSDGLAHAGLFGEAVGNARCDGRCPPWKESKGEVIFINAVRKLGESALGIRSGTEQLP